MNNKDNKEKKKNILVFPDQYSKDYEKNANDALAELRFGDDPYDYNVADDESTEMMLNYLKTIFTPKEATYAVDYKRYEDVQQRAKWVMMFFRRNAHQSLSDEPQFEMEWDQMPAWGGFLTIDITFINDGLFNQSMGFTDEDLELLAKIVGPDSQVAFASIDNNIVCHVVFKHVLKLIDSKH